MDEAERCHRIAILDQGVLVADGTPAELAGELEGRTLLASAAQPRRAQALLLQQSGVISVAQIGNTLRVLTEAGAGVPERLQSVLTEAGVQGEISPVHANLEDVFVAATRGREDARAQAA